MNGIAPAARYPTPPPKNETVGRVEGEGVRLDMSMHQQPDTRRSAQYLTITNYAAIPRCYTYFMQYHRLFIKGGMYFFTVVTYRRQPIFLDPEAIKLFNEALRYTQKRLPFRIVAIVVLPDHIPMIWTLPPDSSDYSNRWRLIKTYFSRNWRKIQSKLPTLPRNDKGEVDIWQSRFWEYLIRDETDLENHIDYIHFNPVKHDLASSPAEWKYSSFMKFVKDEYYPKDWGVKEIWAGDDRME
jgi:putative transposase